MKLVRFLIPFSIITTLILFAKPCIPRNKGYWDAADRRKIAVKRDNPE